MPGGGLVPTIGNLNGQQGIPYPQQNALGNPGGFLGNPENNNYHFRFKIALVGDSGVGKTTFLDAIS